MGGLCSSNRQYRLIPVSWSIHSLFPVSLSQSTKVIVEPDRTTAEFEVPSLTLGDSGFWECRVSTSGGQDSRRFKVNVKGEWCSKVWGIDGTQSRLYQMLLRPGIPVGKARASKDKA